MAYTNHNNIMQTCRCSSLVAASDDPTPPPFMRVIHHRFCQRLEYSRGAPPASTHIGQLKLLLSEIEFLTPFHGLNFFVVYAGAAPGVHVPILAEMFPTMHFILVDPAHSMISNGEYRNIEVRQEFMTNELAREFESRYKSKLLFVSDVRIGAPNDRESDREQQVRIQRDMDAQRAWLEIMRPESSVLKFRLPWNLNTNGKTNYLSGRIYFPVYGKVLTHEARLVVCRDAAPTEYDDRLYEGQMAYFNRVLRPAIQPVFGGGRCYDCTSFRCIIAKYLSAADGLLFDIGECDYSAVDAKCSLIETKLKEYSIGWSDTDKLNRVGWNEVRSASTHAGKAKSGHKGRARR